MFLITRDFQKIFNTADIATMLTDPTVSTSEILNESIDFAIDYIKSKIQHRYDVDSIFIDVNTFDIATTFSTGSLIVYTENDWSATVNYTTGERVNYQNKIYKALQATDNEPPTDAAYWEYVCDNYTFYSATEETLGNYPEDTDYWSTGDTRNSLIKNYAVYIAIDNMFPHINPRLIPEWILNKKDMAVEHLQRINSGKDTVILPLVATATLDGDETDVGNRFSWGSESTQRTIDY